MESHTVGYVHIVRLAPGQELKSALLKVVEEKGWSAAWVHTCVGSLTSASLRMAQNELRDLHGLPHEVRYLSGHFEIVSLVGTLSASGSHLHLSLSDSEGRVIGGHIMGDCRVYTTAEVVLGYSPDWEFSREVLENDSGWPELVAKRKS